MLSKILSLIVATVSIIFISGTAGAQELQKDNSSSWESWRKGFESFELGEQAVLDGRNYEALERFKNALESFKQVKQMNPEWNKNVIDYRIGLCSRKIEAVSKKIAAEKPGSSTADMIPSSVQLEKVRKELAELKSSLSLAMAERDNLKTAAERGAKSEASVKSLIAEKESLEKKIISLTARNEDLNAKLNAAPAIQAPQQNLDDKLLNEKIKYDELDKKYKQLQIAFEDLQKQFNASAKKLSETTASSNDLKSKINSQAENLETSEKARLAAENEKNKMAEQLVALQKTTLSLNKKIETQTQEIEILKKTPAVAAQTPPSQPSATPIVNNTKEMEDLKTKLEKLQSNIEQIKSEKDKTTALNKTLTDELTALKKRFETLSADLKGNTDGASKLKEMLRQKDSSISALENENKKLKIDIEKFSEKLEGTLSKNPSLIASENNRLEKKSMEFTSKIEELSKRVEELSKDKALLKEELKKAEEGDISSSKLKRKEEAINDLVNELESYKTKYTAVSENLEKTQTQLRKKSLDLVETRTKLEAAQADLKKAAQEKKDEKKPE